MDLIASQEEKKKQDKTKANTSLFFSMDFGLRSPGHWTILEKCVDREEKKKKKKKRLRSGGTAR